MMKQFMWVLNDENVTNILSCKLFGSNPIDIQVDWLHM